MALNLSPEGQAALDLAKRALPEGEALGAGLLMASLLHSARLQEKFPELANRLEEPKPLRQVAPDKVPVEESLRLVLASLSQRNPGPLGAD